MKYPQAATRKFSSGRKLRGGGCRHRGDPCRHRVYENPLHGNCPERRTPDRALRSPSIQGAERQAERLRAEWKDPKRQADQNQGQGLLGTGGPTASVLGSAGSLPGARSWLCDPSAQRISRVSRGP